MDIAKAFTRFKQLVNGNGTNNNISVDKPRFIFLFNSEAIRFVEHKLDKKNDDTIRYISELLVKDKELVNVGNEPTHTAFKLPKDYFDLTGVHAFVDNECDTRLKLFEAKADDVDELYTDWNSKPSVKYSESFYILASGELLVHTDDFKIAQAFLTYHRYPNKVDILGYIHLDGTNSTNIDSELSEKAVEEILRRMAITVSGNKGDASQFQIDTARL